MAKKIVTPVEVQASVKGDESVKSFRAQLKEAQQEAFKLAQALGQTSPEAVKAAQKVAELKDQMDDFNATVAGLHPDRFQQFANITSTLANGFAAAQGAAALLGSESEDLQKSMARVQGAMAFAQGISGLKDMQFQLGNIPKMIYSKVVPAFTTAAGAARAIGAALGIGVIIAGVTALIALFKNLDISINGVSRSDAKLLEQQEKRLQASKDNVDALDAQDNILKLQGKSEGDILKMKIAALKVAIDNQKAVIETSKAQATAQIAAAQRNKDILTGILNFISAPFQLLMDGIDAIAKKLGYDTGLGKTFQDLKESAANLVFDPTETKKEADANLAEMNKSLLAMQNTLAGHHLAVRAMSKKAYKEEFKVVEEMEGKTLQLLTESNKQKQQRKKDQLAFDKKMAIDNAKLQADIAAIEKAWQEKRLQQERAFQDNKRQLTIDATLAGLDLLDAITANSNARNEKERKQEFKRQQAFQIASTLVSTYAAAQKAYQSQMQFTPDSPIRATIAAAIAVASGLARVIAIKKQQYNAGTPAPMQQPAGGGGMGSIQQPSFTSSTLGGGTQFAGQFDNKVYVTEGDITGTQRRVRQNRGVSVI